MADEERLVVALEARIKDFERNFARATRTSSDSFGQIERRSKIAADRLELNMGTAAARIATLGKTMAAGFVGGFLAGGIVGIIGQVGEIAKGVAEVGDAARRAGVDVKSFQELRYVAEQNRIGVDSLTDGLKELSNRTAEFINTGGGPGAQAFARLGYDAETLKTKLKDPSALFTEIIGKLSELDRASAINLADEIFGGNGGEKFVQLLDGGADAIDRTRQEARDLGIVMDEELIERAAELDRRFNTVANTVGTALKSAIVDAAYALQQFIDMFNATSAQQSATLEQRQRDLGAERVRLENSILEQRTMGRRFEGDQGALGRAAIDSNIAGLAEKLGALAVEEKTVVEELAKRAPIVVKPSAHPPEVTVHGGATVPPVVPPPVTPPAIIGGGGGGGGASSMREQADAARELIAELQQELRMIGQSDIEQRVNAELRKAGAGATDAQKASIRDLVTQIDTESTAMDRLQSAADSAKGLTHDFLSGLIGDLNSGVDGATALANAFSALEGKLLDMALNAIIESLFSSVFSGAGGGLLGGLFGMKDGGAVKLASGGRVHGPGTGTSDSVPAMLSDGEHVIRAAQAQKFRPLLEAINNGTVGHFATGGAVGRTLAPISHANDNRHAANQNTVTINAPVTVNATGGKPEDNADLAAKIGKELKNHLKGIVASEIRQQQRPGNMLNSRSR